MPGKDHYPMIISCTAMKIQEDEIPVRRQPFITVGNVI